MRVRQPGIGEAHHLEPAQAAFGDGQAVFADFGLLFDYLANAGEKPRVEGGRMLDFVIREPVAHGLRDEPQAVRGLERDRLDDGGLVGRALDLDLVKAG